jgi:hypothetical protein
METTMEVDGTMDLAGEWTLRYMPQQLAGEKREQQLKQQYLSTHPAPSPDLLAKLHEGVKIRAPCDVHTGTCRTTGRCLLPLSSAISDLILFSIINSKTII